MANELNKIINSYTQAGKAEESNWRSIILFGRNVASYKFALGKSLIELAQAGRDSVSLEELAVPYTYHLCEHLMHSPKQATSPSSRFLQTCQNYNEGTISEDELISTAVQLGFNNVLDAFHIVNQGEVPLRFFEKDFSRSTKRLILTDEVFKLASSAEASNILHETESRWNLVETAWEMGVNSNLLAYDEQQQRFMVDNSLRRKDVTSARAALNGYQKGHCFYCYTGIDAGPTENAAKDENTLEEHEATEELVKEPRTLTFSKEHRIEYHIIPFGEDDDDFDFDFGSDTEPRTEGAQSPQPFVQEIDFMNKQPAEPQSSLTQSERNFPRVDYGILPEFSQLTDASKSTARNLDLMQCDVDHFFPHVLQKEIPTVNFNGVWNLVLACIDCNRGEGGKFARIPELRYLDRLYRRNEYLILSHHPLRDSLIVQTGKSAYDRWRFLKKIDDAAIALLPGPRWSIEQREEAMF